MLLYFVRHGQTDWNLARRFQSRTDIPLNSTGILQAQKLRQLLDNRGLALVRIYTSPLDRTRETAQIIGEGSDSEIVVEEAFRELDLGEYEGREERELLRKLGAEYEIWRESCFLQAAPGGESMQDVIERVRGPITNLISSADIEDRLIVGHQAVNTAMKAVLSGRSDAESLRDYMQGNDEIDVWKPRIGKLVERIKLPA